jgi:hypothetical protein
MTAKKKTVIFWHISYDEIKYHLIPKHEDILPSPQPITLLKLIHNRFANHNLGNWLKPPRCLCLGIHQPKTALSFYPQL